MKAEKDPKTGKWLIQYRYTDWQGKRRKSTKRGFATKREAEEWLREFLLTQLLHKCISVLSESYVGKSSIPNVSVVQTTLYGGILTANILVMQLF